MATVPAWFDAEVYFTNKLAQMKAEDPSYEAADLVVAFNGAGFGGEEGLYKHFELHGAAEDVAPNAYFNADEYYIAKAKQYYRLEKGDNTYQPSADEISYVEGLIKAAGMNAWTHYVQFGSKEGVNPSDAFDASAYCAAKAEAMNAAGQLNNGKEWTAEAIEKAIADAGMSTLDHFMTYAGKGEGEISAKQAEAGFPVTDDPATPEPPVLPEDKTFEFTQGEDHFVGGDGNDTFIAYATDTVLLKNVLSPMDSIDGGAGTDTLTISADNVELDGSLPSVKNVEILNVRSEEDIKAFSIAAMEGLETANLDTFASAKVIAAGTTDVFLSAGKTATLEGGKAVEVKAGGDASVSGDALTSVKVNAGNDVTVDGGETVEIETAAGPVLVKGEKLASVSVKGGSGNLPKPNGFYTAYIYNGDDTTKSTTLTDVTLDSVDGYSHLEGDGISNVTLKNLKQNVRISNKTEEHTLNLAVENVGEATESLAVKDNNAKFVNIDAAEGDNFLKFEETSGKTLALKTATISGAGNLDVNFSKAKELTTIDGSAATGDLDLKGVDKAIILKTGAGNDSVELNDQLDERATIELGAGDDILLGTDYLLKNNVIDGGDGYDTVDSSLVGAANAAKFSNFEAVSLSSNIDLQVLSGSNNIEAISIDKVLTSFITVNNVSESQSLTVNANVTDLTLATAKGGSFGDYKVILNDADVEKLTFKGDAAGASLDSLSLHSIGEKDNNSIMVVDEATSTNKTLEFDITITGDSSLTVDFDSNQYSGKIDASDFTGDKLNLGKLNNDASVTVLAGNGATSVEFGTGGGTFTGGKGEDTVIFGDGAGIFIGGEGNDTVISGKGGGTFTGGEGNDTFDVKSANVGDTDQQKMAFVEITDFAVGDQLVFSNLGSFDKVTFDDTNNFATLKDAFNKAVKANSTQWFEFGGATYIISSTNDTFDTDDTVVKLAGVFEDGLVAGDSTNTVVVAEPVLA